MNNNNNKQIKKYKESKKKKNFPDNWVTCSFIGCMSIGKVLDSCEICNRLLCKDHINSVDDYKVLCNSCYKDYLNDEKELYHCVKCDNQKASTMIPITYQTFLRAIEGNGIRIYLGRIEENVYHICMSCMIKKVIEEMNSKGENIPRRVRRRIRGQGNDKLSEKWD